MSVAIGPYAGSGVDDAVPKRAFGSRRGAAGVLLAFLGGASFASTDTEATAEDSQRSAAPVTRQWCAQVRLEKLPNGWWKCGFSTANPQNACIRGALSSIRDTDYVQVKEPVGTCAEGTVYARSAIIEFRRLKDGVPVDPKPVPKIRQWCPEVLLTETDSAFRCSFTKGGGAKETACWGGNLATIQKSQFRIISREAGLCPAMSRFPGSPVVEFLSIDGDTDPEPLPTVSYYCARSAFTEVPALKKGVCTFSREARKACAPGILSSIPLDVYRRMPRAVGVCPAGSLHAGEEILEFRVEGELPPDPVDEAPPAPPKDVEIG